MTTIVVTLLDLASRALLNVAGVLAGLIIARAIHARRSR